MRRRSAAGGLFRLVLAGLVLAGLAWVGWWVAVQSLAPAAGESVALVVAVVVTVALVAAVTVSERRALETLAHEAHRSGSGAGSRALARMLRVDSVTGYAVATTSMLTARTVAGLSPVVAVALAVVLPGWVGAAGLGWIGWVLAVVGPVVAGWTLARAVAAWRGAALTRVTAGGVVAGVLGLTVASLVPLALGVPMTDHAWVGTGLLGAVLAAGLVSGGAAVGDARRRRAVVGELAAVLGVAQSTLEDPGKSRWSVSRAGRVTVRAPLPGDVVKGLPGLRGRVAQVLPGVEVVHAEAGTGIVLDHVTVRARQARLADRDERMATLLSRLALLTGRESWTLDVSGDWDDEGRLTRLTVGAGSDLAPERHRRRERWLEIFEQLSPYHPGTHVRYDDAGGTVTLTRGPDPLARKWSIAEFISTFRDQDADPARSWRSFPFAVDEAGAPVTWAAFHSLVVGQTGAGKGSFLWSILSGLLPAWRAGLVRVVGVDPKAAELTAADQLGRKTPHGMFDRVATDPEQWSALIFAARDEMKARQAVSGRTFRPTTETPVLVLVVDELSALGLLDSDRRRAENVQQALLEIASQGRSDGVLIVGAVQAPQKEAVGKIRPFLGLRVALRTETAIETDLVLGERATEAGAASHRIPIASEGNSYASAGVGYLLAEGGEGYRRVRFPYTSDEDLDAWHAECLAARPLETRVPLGAPAGMVPAGFAPAAGEVLDLGITLDDLE